MLFFFERTRIVTVSSNNTVVLHISALCNRQDPRAGRWCPFDVNMCVEEMPLLIAEYAPVGDGVELCDALQVWTPTSKAAAVTSSGVE